ncbi:MAG: hypothetical protein ACJ8NS_15050 [Chthoniobacterales bacterium]
MLRRITLVSLAILTIAIVGFGVWLYTGGPFRGWIRQMAVGTKYMKSLRDSDIPPWIERSKRLLGEYRPGMDSVGVYDSMFGGKPVPADLTALKIVRIDIFKDQVCYVWMGGMDHTYLEARRLPDDTFTLIAHYTDYRSEVIWPRSPNHAMKRTPAHAITFSIITPLSLQATLALGARRSSCSR